jgi:predicted ATP-grasp superfamily ATP-dependent carboligase
MDGLEFRQEPPRKLPAMIVAFAGWPDAAEAATGAVRYLVEKLGATKFAEIDPEEFYDFTATRPETRINEEGERVIDWPANDFYYHAPKESDHGLLLYVGTEPNLRWRAFSRLMLSVADRCGVELVVSLGALLDEVPHTREPSVTGRATSAELEQKVEWLGIRNSDYQGPTGIHISFMEACVRHGMSLASIWGHSPHYVNTTPNPRVTHALLTRLRRLVEFDVPMDELQESADAYILEVDQAIAGRPELTAYVKKLEEQFDSAIASTSAMPSAEDMVEELEHYLKSQLPPPDNTDES